MIPQAEQDSPAEPGQGTPVPVLAVRDVSVSFGGTRALDHVNLEVLPGEIHGLVGQNGSGKSTLIKVLSGYHTPEPGASVHLAGEDVTLPLSPEHVQRYGMRFVHQDLGLSPQISVLENLTVHELATRRVGFINWRRERDQARAVFEPFGRPIDVTAAVRDLSPPDQAHVAIVRAVDRLRRRRASSGWSPGVLVLDEVTAFLSRDGREQLWQLARDIVGYGDSVLFVSHYLDEVLGFTDRVTVLRDGRLVATVPSSQLDNDKLIELIIGRSLAPGKAVAPEEQMAAPVGGDVEVADLAGALVRGVGFTARTGEVLGLTGLLGSGFEEVNGLLFGALPASSGRLLLGGRPLDVPAMTPGRAIEAGIAYVPEDRGRDGGVAALTVAENVTLQILERYQSGPRALRRIRMMRDVRAVLEDFDVRPRRPGAKLADLSGGNQQKVIMAKWLMARPRLLLMHEPTHGIDVGARAQILERVREEAAKGIVVLWASSDPKELADGCDRVLVFGRGRVTAELTGEDVNKDAITEHCYGVRTG
ncbi:MAG: sugar ABC transporter ATP-binding protein [Acidimicrobiales bacterium]